MGPKATKIYSARASICRKRHIDHAGRSPIYSSPKHAYKKVDRRTADRDQASIREDPLTYDGALLS